jgi:hypothetical protein
MLFFDAMVARMRIAAPLFALAVSVGCATTPPPASPPPPEQCATGEWRPTPRGDAPLVEQLDKQAIVAGMSTIKPCVQACLPRPSAWGSMSRDVWSVALTIGTSGQPTSVKVIAPQTTGPVVDCIVAAVSRASFPPTTGSPISLVYPFVAR